MKKTILAALLCAITTSASAVTLSWASATAMKFDGSNLKSDTGVSGYLIYLGTSDLADSYSVTKSSTAETIISSIGTNTGSSKTGSNAMSKLSGSFDFNYSDGYANDSSKFALLLTYVKDGTTYFNLSSAAYTLSGGNDEDVANQIPLQDPNNASFAFSYGSAGESKTLSKGGGWTVAVPEPSTAMLALAGLALLIKRRRA